MHTTLIDFPGRQRPHEGSLHVRSFQGRSLHASWIFGEPRSKPSSTLINDCNSLSNLTFSIQEETLGRRWDIGYKLPWESPMTYAPSKSRGQTLAAKTNKSLSESPDLDARKTMLLCKSQRLILPKQDLLPSLGYLWTGCIRKFCRHMLAHFVLYRYISLLLHDSELNRTYASAQYPALPQSQKHNLFR